MTLQELKTKATASELTLIERVEALVNADAMRAAALEQVRTELRAIGKNVQAKARGYDDRWSESELLGRAVHEYLKENP